MDSPLSPFPFDPFRFPAPSVDIRFCLQIERLGGSYLGVTFCLALAALQGLLRLPLPLLVFGFAGAMRYLPTQNNLGEFLAFHGKCWHFSASELSRT